MQAPYKPAPIDLFKGWSKRPWYETAGKIGQILARKGFCVLEGDLETFVMERAVLEAEDMMRDGQFTRPYKEVLCGLFGEIGSCWTCELPLQGAAEGDMPAEEQSLRQVEKMISDLGMDMATCSFSHFGMILEGRTTAMVHRTRTAQEIDSPHPPLQDPEEADGYVNLFCRKKLKLICHLGPDNSNITIMPHGKIMDSWRAMLVPGMIVLVRGDVACVSEIRTLSPDSEVGHTMELDFLAEQKGSLQEQARDLLPCPEELDRWYMSHVQAIVANDVTDNMPDHWMRFARQQYCKRHPVRILQVAYEMPFAALNATGARGSSSRVSGGSGLLQALLGGADCIARVPTSRWDVEAYYDEDAQKTDDFKMYTRHIGCLDLSSAEVFDFQQFGMTREEIEGMDKRQKLLAVTAVACLEEAGWKQHGHRGKELGVFCGLSHSDAYMGLLSGTTKLSKAAAQAGVNAPAGASRLAYLLACTGPSVTVDTGDSSGSAALDSAISSIRAGRCGPALASSVNLLLHPFSVILLCGAGLISKAGCSRVFDAASDGMVRSEGCVSLLLTDHDGKAKQAADDGEPQFEDFSKCKKLIAGSALSTQGVASSMTATSAAAMQEVLRHALVDGETAGYLLDCTEVHAGGRCLADAVELSVMRHLTGSGDPKAGAGVLHTAKSLFGDAGAPASLMALAGACVFMELGAHAPCIHLRQLMHPAVLDEEEDEGDDSVLGRMLIPLEVLEARTWVQTVGVSSFGGTGTNVHHVLWGKRPEEKHAAIEPRPVQWWPGAEYTQTPLDMSHYIIGTWSAWEKMEQMRIEPDGTYVHTVTLGENGWEAFQIFFQGKKTQCYHPEERWGGSECKVHMGADVDRSQVFVLDARPKKVQLLNAEQFKVRQERLEEAKNAGAEMPEWEYEGVAYFSKDYMPEGHDNVGEDGVGMPVMEQEQELWGVPGDKYIIRFHTVAKFRRMELIKVPRDYKHFEFFPNKDIEVLDMSKVSHKYYITGEYNYWTFDALTENANEEGLFEGEVLLTKDSTAFQIVRDKDWDQVFYPKRPAAGQGVEIRGADGTRSKNAWSIEGKPGEVFRISFRRRVTVEKAAGDDEIAAKQELVRQEESAKNAAMVNQKLADTLEILTIGYETGIYNEEQFEEEKDKAKAEYAAMPKVYEEKDFITLTVQEQAEKMALWPKGIRCEKLSLGWQRIGKRTVDYKAIVKSHKYYLTGSWNQFKTNREMEPDEARTTWSREIVVGSSGRESFQILLNENLHSSVHPACEGSSYLDPEHEVRGPDAGDSKNFWLIGKHKGERIRAGDTVRITLVLDVVHGVPQPKTVTWEKVEHIGVSEAGCQSGDRAED